MKILFYYTKDNTNKKNWVVHNLKDCFLLKVISFKTEKNCKYQICKWKVRLITFKKITLGFLVTAIFINI